MSLDLSSVNAKLDRGEDYVKALKSKVGAWMEVNPYTISPQVNANFTRHSIIVSVPPEEPPSEEWALILGDAVHNIRSALDHLVYAIARHESGENPPPDENILAFPICDNPDKFAGSLWRIKTLSCPVRTMIELMQPYNRRHPSIPPPLAILRNLDDADKHRLLQFTYPVPYGGDYGFSGPQAQINPPSRVHVHTGTIENGTELIVYFFDRPNPKMYFDQKIAALGFAIWHGKLDPVGPDWTGRNDFSAILSLLMREVRYVVDRVISSVRHR